MAISGASIGCMSGMKHFFSSHQLMSEIAAAHHLRLIVRVFFSHRRCADSFEWDHDAVVGGRSIMGYAALVVQRRLLAFSSDSEIQLVKECSIEMESRSCFVMTMSVIGEHEVYDLEDHSTMLSLEMSIIDLD